MAEQLAIDWRPAHVIEARCGCATSARAVCEDCRACDGCCRCLRPASSAPQPPTRALRRALVDTLAAWHATRH